MPTVTKAIEVKLDEAILLADLYEIVSDLDAALQFCESAIKIGKSDPRDFCIEEGLVIAAIIKYGRCFTNGVRLSLKLEDVSELNSVDRQRHEYFIALRHKWLAHAVNAFEETYVTASASVKDGVLLPITSIHAGQHRMVLTRETAQHLAALVTDVREIIRRRVASEEVTLLALIQTLPLDVIHSGDLHAPRMPTVQQVHESRERGVHSNKLLQRTRSKQRASEQ